MLSDQPEIHLQFKLACLYRLAVPGACPTSVASALQEAFAQDDLLSSHVSFDAVSGRSLLQVWEQVASRNAYQRPGSDLSWHTAGPAGINILLTAGVVSATAADGSLEQKVSKQHTLHIKVPAAVLFKLIRSKGVGRAEFSQGGVRQKENRDRTARLEFDWSL